MGGVRKVVRQWRKGGQSKARRRSSVVRKMQENPLQTGRMGREFISLRYKKKELDTKSWRAIVRIYRGLKIKNYLGERVKWLRKQEIILDFDGVGRCLKMEAVTPRQMRFFLVSYSRRFEVSFLRQRLPPSTGFHHKIENDVILNGLFNKIYVNEV